MHAYGNTYCNIIKELRRLHLQDGMYAKSPFSPADTHCHTVSVVFVTHTVNRNVLDEIICLAAGVMIYATA